MQYLETMAALIFLSVTGWREEGSLRVITTHVRCHEWQWDCQARLSCSKPDSALIPIPTHRINIATEELSIKYSRRVAGRMCAIFYLFIYLPSSFFFAFVCYFIFKKSQIGAHTLIMYSGVKQTLYQSKRGYSMNFISCQWEAFKDYQVYIWWKAT